MAALVIAAGGVVWRHRGTEPEVLVVHRPAQRDWTFPKGKLEATDATLEACARREVEEETGLRCSLGHELATTHYTDAKGRPKQVRYWEMTALSGEFTPNREVDQVAWLRLDEARRQLSYDSDRSVLDAFSRFAGR